MKPFAIAFFVGCFFAIATLSAAPFATDDFNDGNFSSTPSGQDWTVNRGTWQVDAGVTLRQNANDPAATYYTSNPPFTIQLNGFSETGAYNVQGDMSINGGAGSVSVGIAFRMSNAGVAGSNSMYAIVFFPGYSGGALRFIEINNGVYTTSGDTNLGFTPPVSPAPPGTDLTTLNILVNGSTFTATVSHGLNTSAPIIYTDSTLTGGGVGFFSQNIPGAAGYFDNFVLFVPEPTSGIALLAAGAMFIRRRGR